eukprot:CAMPEP_0118989602 /NCGR_PEP_ID=MMETSP1173-20130426/48307_1 /TAXON_ID=1034831 /ORGANISM="Rhizochromulina marina cf, Strain CCMP1243" /LENGTH=43 /DNA_ID= /DNA_START= /DNA_END= /DNA_ORIENTATION=
MAGELMHQLGALAGCERDTVCHVDGGFLGPLDGVGPCLNFLGV